MPDKIQLDKDMQQKKLMRSAGFKIDSEYNGLRVWARGAIRVALATATSPSLKRLIGHVINQSAYRMRQNAHISFIPFKTSNDGQETRGDS